MADVGNDGADSCPKTIEFDKRLAASFPKLEINQDIRDRVLALALEEDTPEPGPLSALGWCGVRVADSHQATFILSEHLPPSPVVPIQIERWSAYLSLIMSF